MPETTTPRLNIYVGTQTKSKMLEYTDINWSLVCRKAIEAEIQRIEIEKQRLATVTAERERFGIT